MDETNKLTDFEIVNLKYKKIYVPQNGYCMYTQNICSHYQVDSNLRMNKVGYYYYFYSIIIIIIMLQGRRKAFGWTCVGTPWVNFGG